MSIIRLFRVSLIQYRRQNASQTNKMNMVYLFDITLFFPKNQRDWLWRKFVNFIHVYRWAFRVINIYSDKITLLDQYWLCIVRLALAQTTLVQHWTNVQLTYFSWVSMLVGNTTLGQHRPNVALKRDTVTIFRLAALARANVWPTLDLLCYVVI